MTQPDNAPVELAERIGRALYEGQGHDGWDARTPRQKLPWLDDADAVIDELIDLAGTGKLLRGIAEYRRPHA